MAKVIFNYKSIDTTILCKTDETFKSIKERLKTKLKEDISKTFILYNGKCINEEQTFKEVANIFDRERNTINVILLEGDNLPKKDKFVISKEIICQKCYENSFIKIKEFKFSFKCKNGHKLDNISIRDFNEKQKIDISKYKCNKCEKNRTEIFENNFYICSTCDLYLCPLCKSNHDKKHKIIDFNNKYNICNKHCFYFVKFCNVCGMNICMRCQNEHKEHNYIDFGDLFIDKQNIQEEMDSFKEKMNLFIDDLNKNIQNIINNVKQNMEIYYEICNKIINNYDEQKLTYQNMLNIQEINKYNNNICKEINNLKEKNGVVEKFNFLFKIYNEINNKINDINISQYITAFEPLTKNIIEGNNKDLMIISEKNQGNDIIKYLLNKMNKKYIEINQSKFTEDEKNEKYRQDILDNLKYLMKNNNIILMKDFDCFSYNYFLENMNLIRENTLKSNEILTEENNFKSIISIGINNISNLNNSIQEKLEKQCLDYNIFLDQNDKNIINNLLDYLNIITCFDVNMKIKIDLQHLLINCKKNDIEALIFKIKNDIIIKYNADNNHWIFKEGQEYERQILKLFFSKIAPLFCEDIITSLISFHKNSKDAKYKMMDDLIIEAYKKSYYYNFENYFKEINTKRSIIYTFSKEARNLFKEIKIIENKFGKFDEDSTYYISIESITRENDLSIELKKFLFTEKKQLLIITFSENDLKFINSVNALIDNLEKENPKLNEKCVIFIINKQRKKLENIFNDEKYDSLSFINEKYNQIFIDDLFGKDYSNIFDIIIKLDNDWQKDYLLTTKFIENNITNVLNYIKFNLPIQNKEINSNNMKEQIANIILKKDILKNLFTDYLIEQGKGIKDLFKNAFKYYNKEEKNEEFFQIIDNEIKKNFIIFLLKIILHLLKKDILIPLYYNLDIIMKNKYLYDMIKSEFNQNNYCPVKLSLNGNNIKVFINLKIPNIKIQLI